MPKIKTHKSSKKRLVRVSGTGKLILRKMSISHRARFKSKRAKKQAAHTQVVAKARAKKLSILLNES